MSLHIRHGDYLLNLSDFPVLPFKYYRDCIAELKKFFFNITVFVFAKEQNFVKRFLNLDVLTEFVSGNGLTDVEELHLMSICQHNIIANSTFSWWGAWLNQNPDKKVFIPVPSHYDSKTDIRYSPTTIENSPLQSDRWIRVPFDFNNQPKIEIRPYFSLLLVVNNDIATLAETLESIFGQDYKFYELIIIDNASTDGSGKICRQIAKELDNVTYIKLYDKVSNGAAWNMAFNIAQGNFVIFFKGNDKFFSDMLNLVYLFNESLLVDIVNSTIYLQEDEHGTIDFDGKKFVIKKDELFSNVKKSFYIKIDSSDKAKMLTDNAKLMPFATKVFKRKFLLDKAIKFDEKVADAELLFIAKTMLKADDTIFMPNMFYIAPKS